MNEMNERSARPSHARRTASTVFRGVAAGRHSQRGASAVIFAVLAVFMFGAMAFAIDLGRAFMVRNELQNAADLAALGGANGLYPPVAATGLPNWATANGNARGTVTRNLTEGAPLTQSVVQLGYWDMSNNDPPVWGSPTTPPTVDQVPAVRVTINRDTAGINSGPISMTFGRLLGWDTMTASASAVAVLAVPGSVGPGALAPYAITKCMLDTYFDESTGKARLAPNGQPYELVFGNKNNCKATPSCACGTWTSLDTIDNSQSNIVSLITSGNTSSLAVGTNIHIPPGDMAGAFADFNNAFAGKAITLPVVDTATCDLSTKDDCPIRAFACLQVDYAVGSGNGAACYSNVGYPTITRTYATYNPAPVFNPGRCIVGYLRPGVCKVPGGTGGPGPYYGAYVPPRLVQ